MIAARTTTSRSSACRPVSPKSGTTPESTWEALIGGVDGISDLPEGRWTEFTSDPRFAEILESSNIKGGYLDDVRSFDADFFQMSPREVEMVDPQQRLALELTWEALEHAHIPPAERPQGCAGGSVHRYVDQRLSAAGDPRPR